MTRDQNSEDIPANKRGGSLPSRKTLKSGLVASTPPNYGTTSRNSTKTWEDSDDVVVIESDVSGNIGCDGGDGPLHQSDIPDLQAEHGLNTVETGRKRKWHQLLLRAPLHPFNVLLILLAIFSGAVGEYGTMGIMLLMVLVASLLRFYHEYKSEEAASSLLQYVATKVTAIREEDGAAGQPDTIKEMTVMSINLVPGDWIKLLPGELVPADVEIIKARGFHVTQAALTGEALPVEKFKYIGGGVGDRSHPFRLCGGSYTSTASTVTLLQEDRPPMKFSQRVVIFFRKVLGLPVYTDENERDFESGKNTRDLDRPDLCFMGSAVVSGTATCRVLHTGSKTRFGQLAGELSHRAKPNAFQLGIRRLSWLFFITMICVFPVVFLLHGLLVEGGWDNACLFALAVAVGLTPEMLPMILSTNLAKGAAEMSRKKCIVKQLDAIINMGSVDVLCTDKTGTLTKNIVTLNRYVNAKGSSSSVPLFLGYLNSHFQSSQQNPLDWAIDSFFEREQIFLDLRGMTPIVEKFREVDELPFDFVRRRISVILQETSEGSQRNRVLICKGAVAEILERCTSIVKSSEIEGTRDTTNVYQVIRGQTETEKMSSLVQRRVQRIYRRLNEEGLRVIGVAFKRVPLVKPDTGEAVTQYSVEDEGEMVFVGLLAFLDPPKECARDAVKVLIENNVSVKVLTGDSPLVCKKICLEIGLPATKVITGEEIQQVKRDTPEKLSTIAEEYYIFAKLTPLQKMDIVRTLKKNGHVVAFLGDGINDASALTEADVGISVDSGSDICKESADIVLLEKDLTVVVDGIITGRKTYGNTLKYIVMTVSSNFGNVLSILVASAWLPFEPMKSLHLLVQNLLYDISQIAIPWDHMDPEFLLLPHTWSMRSILQFMVVIGPWSSVFDICTFLYLYFYFGIQTKDNPDKVALFQTTWFTVGLLTQTLIVHMIRTSRIPFIQSRASLPVGGMTLVVMAIGLILPYFPGVNTFLGMVGLPWEVYFFIAGILVSYCVVAQLVKMLYIRVFNEWY